LVQIRIMQYSTYEEQNQSCQRRIKHNSIYSQYSYTHWHTQYIIKKVHIYLINKWESEILKGDKYIKSDNYFVCLLKEEVRGKKEA
jgi:hypothetical protein